MATELPRARVDAPWWRRLLAWLRPMRRRCEYCARPFIADHSVATCMFFMERDVQTEARRLATQVSRTPRPGPTSLPSGGTSTKR